MSGRLWKSVREERGLAYSVYARIESEKNGGLFYALSYEEVEIAKNYLKGRFIFGA